MSQQKNNNPLIQQLTKHFNLESELFSDESGFFFEGAQRQHNLETLRHLACFGDMVLFLTGDKGAGKTLILRKLSQSSFEGLNVVYLDCESLVQESQGNPGYILDVCLRSLGLQVKKLSLTESLNCLLSECHRRVASDGVRTLFAFDNADKLPKKELQAYFSFCKDLPSESALVMLFSGSIGLIQASKISSNLEQDAWWHQVQLKPFSQADVLSYLEQALKVAGSSERLELTDNQIQQMVDLGKGLPGRINKIFPSVVLEPGLLKIKAKNVGRGVPVLVMFGLAGLLILSFIFVSFQHGLLDRVMPVFSLDEPSSGGSEGLDVSTVASDLRVKSVDDYDLKQKARIAMLDSVIKDKGISLPLESKAEIIVDTPISNNEGSAGSSHPTKDIVSTEEGRGLISEVSPSDNKVLEDVVPSADVSVAPPKNSQDLNQKSQALIGADSAKLGNDKKLIKSPPTEDELRASSSFRSKKWLQSQSSASYLVQILGSYSEETALNFIKKIGEQEFDIFYLMTEHKGKSWYVVFYGIFPGKEDAQNAVKSSPKIIRSQNPWIRRSSEVLASYP